MYIKTDKAAEDPISSYIKSNKEATQITIHHRRSEKCINQTYGCGLLSVPVVDVIAGFVLFEHDIRVTLVKLSMELLCLLDWIELLDSVDFERVLTRLGEECLSLVPELPHVVGEVFAVQLSIFVSCFNHGNERSILLVIC